MISLKKFLTASLISAMSIGIQGCDSDTDDSNYLNQPTALVTVCPQPDESVLLQLNDATTLRPVNLKTSPFGKKEVRALVNYNPEQAKSGNFQDVRVNWIDSIRTKLPVIVSDSEYIEKFGNDPVEIINDWVTVAEDGYLTLRVRALWSGRNRQHSLDLLAGMNQDKPLEFELRHNSNGDNTGNMGDALIAFNLNTFLRDKHEPVKITLRWKSFSGEKSADFYMSANRKPSNIQASGFNIQGQFN